MIKGAQDNGHEVIKYYLNGLASIHAAVAKSLLKEKTADLKMMGLKSLTSWLKVPV